MADFGKNVTGPEREQLAADTIRVLSAEAVQAAKSGHPGLPLGAADLAHVLWTRHLRVDPTDPDWIDRDRFVLSAGHGSMLLYSLLHLSGFDLPLDELRAFRQWESRTAGHPEYGHTEGVDMTAGPLGAGFATAVGMALGERMLAARFNQKNHTVIDHHTYVLSGDGCMMEGVTSEAASLAGHLKLGKLICFYDDNEISIEGGTDLAFTENVNARFEAYGWHVLDIDGHDHAAVDQAIQAAKAETERPSIIVCHTTIGHGAPNKAGQHKVHGEPLGDDEVRAMKQNFGWPDEAFFVPEATRALWDERREQWKGVRAEWNARLEAFRQAKSGLAKQFDKAVAGELPRNIRKAVAPFEVGKAVATRSSGGEVLNQVAARLPELVGGSADLAPSTKTELKESGFVTPGDYAGRNIHFGVREHAMGSMANGLALHGGFVPFCATFMVFADYMRPPIRLAALMNQGTIFYFTHDSIFVGEDGPTHQPVEQLASLRAIPHLHVMRPCDAEETAECIAMAIERRDGPTALSLTRQNLPTLDREVVAPVKNARKGAYILKEAPGGKPDLILLASGSEVHLALEAYDLLVELGRQPRVVSVPCMEVFEEQADSYKRRLLPTRVKARAAIEASLDAHWDRYLGPKGIKVGMNGFGASAPAERLAEEFGFTASAVVARLREAGLVE
ncbi:MAG: transketolase [Planctomycetota bacterium]